MKSKNTLFGIICILYLASLVGCGATYREQVVDQNGNVVATTEETDIGYWGIDSKEMTEYEKCLVEKRNLPGDMAKSMCTEKEVVEHSRDLYGVPQMPYYNPGYNPNYGW